jgi:hypothetical protein
VRRQPVDRRWSAACGSSWSGSKAAASGGVNSKIIHIIQQVAEISVAASRVPLQKA